ncbi:capsid assembly scaffolding protein Gp46 family protein [Clostridium neonatale]|uniref:capsid assembly scaffolding protein Gp46 family protein n=1 Tax=Clostridium neonatale TaxID=137838 RepID=UPI00291C2CE2|nr:conserved hypothetical protein [Clostridium neonatale]
MKDDEKKEELIDNAEIPDSESEKLADESQDVANDGAGEITLEQFKSALENNIECKGYFDSLCDKTVNTRLDKGIESWKEKNLNNLIEKEINIRYPQKSETEIALEKAQEEKRQLELQVKYQNLMVENKLPLELLNFVAGKDLEETTNKIKKFNSIVGTLIDEREKAIIKAHLSAGNYIPPGENGHASDESADLWKMML